MKLAHYIPPRPVDEPHEARCQKVRISERHCCTCESNSVRRREGIRLAAVANDFDAMRDSGSMEQCMWHTHRHEIDPEHVQPYGHIRARHRA